MGKVSDGTLWICTHREECPVFLRVRGEWWLLPIDADRIKVLVAAHDESVLLETHDGGMYVVLAEEPA